MDKFIVQPGTSLDVERSKNLDIELTNKFLNGQMSFAEYSSEWYCDDNKQDIEDDRISDEDTVGSPSTQSSEKVTRRRKVTRLTPALMGLMGEANLRFVRGEKEIAEKMCHEIIKEVPDAAEPYQTLAQIYEDDPEKSLQFSLLAAHLNPSDANEWLRLAAISKQRNDIKQEMICYTQAINADPKNFEIHLKRLELLAKLEESKYPLYNLNINRVRCYHRIVTSLPVTEGATIMKYARLAASMYHESNEVEKTLEVMSSAYAKCSKIFTVEDLNILLELLIAKKEYKTCIEIFVGHVGIDIEAEIQTVKKENNEIEEQTHYLNCTIPNNLPIDLRSKLLVCFIHLGAINLVQTLLHDFLSNDVEKAGDLYMDIEEALSAVGYHELAMQLLEPLVQNTSYDLGAVWLKHAECLYKLGREEDAIESYYKVLKHAPQHPTARKKLFTILEKKGSIDEALNILQQDYKYVVNARLLYEQCIVLKKYGKLLKYLEVGEALLSKTFPRYRHQAELKIALRTKGGVELIHNFRVMRGENPFNEDDIHFDEEEEFKFSPEEEWLFFKELLEVAYKHKKYSTMQRLCYGAIMSKALAPHRKNLEFLCFQSCLLNSDYYNAMKFIREITQKNRSPRTWTLLNFVLSAAGEYSQIKFLYRLFDKDTSMVKNLFLGNNFLTSGRYLVALKYFLEYHEQCKEPISALLIAISNLVMAAQRTMDKHHNLIVQGLCYMMIYNELRKCSAESNYNIGRAFHMLNINNLAIEYYEKVLNSDPISKCSQHGIIDLKKEAAYNLILLYKGHSPQMARRYLTKYLVID
ncbi:unnamed protein product [Diatraea saccharalis]|uniref:General transcription factor 3C polypeptide 3 n=1 Tax=Diatraea saccharalis TaxID=40085 RepID=A0A9N9RHG9_9NEOP|nr:unnamed protein product [Diatraea saccharalis]